MAKYDVQERIAQMTERIEDQVANEMINDFRRKLNKQFKLRKDMIEDWQSLTGVRLEAISNRLRVIADKNPWTENNILDMALICSLIWNELINGEDNQKPEDLS